MDELTKELQKAMADMSADSLREMVMKATDNSTGFSTRQSLSDQIEDITRRDTPLFDMLPRESVINPIHQWDEISSLDTGGSSAGPIDSVGSDADVEITRYSEGIRYYRHTTTVGQFTDAMSRPQLRAQDTVDQGAVNKIMHDIESDIISGASGGLNIRGMDDVIQNLSGTDNNIDAGGSAITSTADFTDAQKTISENGGQATHFLLNADDRIAFNNTFTNQISYNDPQNVDRFGYTVQRFQSPFGEADVLFDRFVPDKDPQSTAYVVDMSTWALGEPEIYGTSGIAMQDLAKTGPAIHKLLTYYGLLVYRAPAFNARVHNIG